MTVAIEETNHGPKLTDQTLLKILDSDRRLYYRTKDLNDKLFIHYGGYRKLENLEAFTGLKVLYGECNAFSKIEGLSECRLLRSLFLNQNCISGISGLDNLKDLWSLNLSDNFIKKIENLSHLLHLNTLIIANNSIGSSGLSDILELVESPITCLDIQNNKIEDVNCVEEVFSKMRNLSVLYLKGNPVVKSISNYRKRLIVRIPGLKFLDDRPVFDDERRCSVAWSIGGLDAEKAEREAIAREKEEAYKRNADAFNSMIQEARDNHREIQCMRRCDRYTEETDPVESPEMVQRRWYAERRDRQESAMINYSAGESTSAGETGSSQQSEFTEELPELESVFSGTSSGMEEMD